MTAVKWQASCSNCVQRASDREWAAASNEPANGVVVLVGEKKIRRFPVVFLEPYDFIMMLTFTKETLTSITENGKFKQFNLSEREGL